MTGQDPKQQVKTLWNIADTLGDAYEYLIGQFTVGTGKKAGEFYTPAADFQYLLRHHSSSPIRLSATAGTPSMPWAKTCASKEPAPR
jgi:hypothetical protein